AELSQMLVGGRERQPLLAGFGQNSLKADPEVHKALKFVDEEVPRPALAGRQGRSSEGGVDNLAYQEAAQGASYLLSKQPRGKIGEQDFTLVEQKVKIDR